MRKTKDNYRGCLVGGAIGDALGLPVEFLKFPEIRFRFGIQGITDLERGYRGRAMISDDTQMTMFTAEGLLRAIVRGTERGICDVPSIVFNAYQRWLTTQGVESWLEPVDGWLIALKDLHQRRGPGRTCLTALSGGHPGTMDKPINNSKGCGGVMRSAPVGLVWNRQNSFAYACECAALTHGHPSGYLSAGALAHIIACIIDGLDLGEAVQDALAELSRYPGHGECADLLNLAVILAGEHSRPLDCIPQLGEGWVGEEALAIAVYCALRFSDDFRQGVIAAVNHSGDSDSTGAITGNILGAWLGLEKIPEAWAELVEFRDELIQLADDMLIRYEDTPAWRKKYPGW